MIEKNTTRSSGKSGEQKKLAYTILASAPTYQFGRAKTNQNRRPSLRRDRELAVVQMKHPIWLDLFKKLNLQLLIITPLQKIHIIENYINRVHFVSNEEGDCSRVRDIPIEEYHEKKLAQAS